MDDDAIEADLRRAVLRYDRPSVTAVRAAEAAFEIRALDAELALLTFDSRGQPLSSRLSRATLRP